MACHGGSTDWGCTTGMSKLPNFENGCFSDLDPAIIHLIPCMTGSSPFRASWQFFCFIQVQRVFVFCRNKFCLAKFWNGTSHLFQNIVIDKNKILQIVCISINFCFSLTHTHTMAAQVWRTNFLSHAQGQQWLQHFCVSACCTDLLIVLSTHHPTAAHSDKDP